MQFEQRRWRIIVIEQKTAARNFPLPSDENKNREQILLIKPDR